MAAIARSFIEDLNTRTDLVALVGAHVTFKRKSGKNHYACCPFHQEKTPSFTVNEDRNRYHCFGCKKSGNAIDFLMEYAHLDFVEAVETLAERLGLPIVYEEKGFQVKANQAQRSAHREGLACLEAAALFFQQQLQTPAAAPARAYLERRTLSTPTQAQFQLGYAPPHNALLRSLSARFSLELLLKTGLIAEKEGRHYDRFRERIIFPIRNARGQVIAFGGRALGDAQPKYLNSPETSWFAKRNECYGLFEALNAHDRDGGLVVTEGYVDVVRLWQAGLKNGVATLGTAIGESHIQQLKRRSKTLIFAFDGDNAGRKAATAALSVLFSAYDEALTGKFLFLPEGEDPDSFVAQQGAEAWRALVQTAQPASEFLLSLLAQHGDKSVEGRTQIAGAAREWLAKLPQNSYRQLLAAAIAERFGFQNLAFTPRSAANTAPPKPATQRAHPYLSKRDREMALMVCQYPELAMSIHFADYRSDLERFSPLTVGCCYVVQCAGADGALLKCFLEKNGVDAAIPERTRETAPAEMEHGLKMHFAQLVNLARNA